MIKILKISTIKNKIIKEEIKFTSLPLFTILLQNKNFVYTFYKKYAKIWIVFK